MIPAPLRSTRMKPSHAPPLLAGVTGRRRAVRIALPQEEEHRIRGRPCRASFSPVRERRPRGAALIRRAAASSSLARWPRPHRSAPLRGRLVSLAPQLPPPPLLALVPVAFAAQHFATAASTTVVPWLEWPFRILAVLFYFLSPDTLYGGEGLRAIAAAVALYALAYGLARIGFAARDALRAATSPDG